MRRLPLWFFSLLLALFPTLVFAADAASSPPTHGWTSVLPPIIAVGLALYTRQVLPALFASVWVAATLHADGNPLAGFLLATSKYTVAALADTSHASIIIFSMALAGMVGVMSRSGGSQGIVEKMSPFASTPRKAQIATWLMGLVIFFDDYANSLLVGNTMRPLTDKLKISREKLAFIVDATAAPVAGLAAISTWVGFEVGLIGAAYELLGRTEKPFSVFLATIPLRFYSILWLAFGFAVCVSGKDFGPMLKAERKARNRKESLDEAEGVVQTNPHLVPPPGAPRRWHYAVIPVLFIFFGTAGGLWLSGSDALHANFVTQSKAAYSAEQLTQPAVQAEVASQANALYAKAGVNDILGEADTYKVLLFVSFAGSLIAMVLPIFDGVLSTEQSIEAWMAGTKTMIEAMMILVLAWSLSDACKDLETGKVLAEGLKNVLNPFLLPSLTFIGAAAISFATGSSWGTMSILMPISIPLAVKLALPVATAAGPAGSAAFAAAEAPILLGTIAAILAGSCFGDHCSPISDTTILSSMASGCDHVEHVRTQMPYAMVPGVAAIALGHIPAAYGVPPVLCIALGILACVAVLLLVGKNAEDPVQNDE